MHEVLSSTNRRDAANLPPSEQLRVFRNLVHSLASDAMKALSEVGKDCQDSEQAEQCVLVGHYLDYMKRLCEGKV